MCSPVEDHDLVPSLSHNIESQTHSRVPECDSRPSVQIEPSAVNRMVTASAGVQTDLPKVAHSSCRLICHSSEPQTSTVRISGPRPKGVGHRCSEHKLDGSHCLCLPSDGSPSQGDKKMDSSKNKASLWRWQRELLHLRGHQQEPSTGQSGPYLRNGAEKIRWISPLHLRNKFQTFSCTCIKI